jgi:hypothetical protein
MRFGRARWRTSNENVACCLGVGTKISSRFWKDADHDILIRKQANAEYARPQQRLSTDHKAPSKFGNTSPALAK